MHLNTHAGMRVAKVAGDGSGGGVYEHMKVRSNTRFKQIRAVHSSASLTESYAVVCLFVGLQSLTDDTKCLQDIKWEFAVIASKVPNAFVVPGGKVRADLAGMRSVCSFKG